MRTLRAMALLLALSTTGLLAVPAYARDDAVAAEALFDQGRKAMENQQYETACARFAESQRLEPAAGTLMNLAVCKEKLGLLASAWQHWREALDALPKADDRRTFAQERLDTLKPRLSYMTLLPPAGTSTRYEVFRDGIKLGNASLGLELPADPGSHEIVVRANGHDDFRVNVELAEQEHEQVPLALGRERPSAPPPPTLPSIAPTADRGAKQRRIAGVVVGGVGLVGIGGAVATGLLLADRQSTVEDNGGADRLCNQTGLDAARSGQTLLVLNTVAWGVGIVGLGVGGVLVATSAGRGQRSRGTREAAVTLSLAPQRGGPMLTLTGVLP